MGAIEKYKLPIIILSSIFGCSIIKGVFLSYRFGWDVLSWATLEVSILIFSGPLSAFVMWPKRSLDESWFILASLSVLFAAMVFAHVWIRKKWSAFIAVVGGVAWFLSGVFCTLLFSS